MSDDVLEPYYDFPDSQLIKLQIKQSKLPASGLGVFAKESISQGEIICEYYGSILSNKGSEDVYDEQDKMMQIDSQYCLISRSPASRCNDIVLFQPELYNDKFEEDHRQLSHFPYHPNMSHNAKLTVQPKRKVFIQATKQINEGDEIYISYGFDYWKFFYQSQQQPKTAHLL